MRINADKVAVVAALTVLVTLLLLVTVILDPPIGAVLLLGGVLAAGGILLMSGGNAWALSMRHDIGVALVTGAVLGAVFVSYDSWLQDRADRRSETLAMRLQPDLDFVDLRGVDLSGASLRGRSLDGTVLDITTNLRNADLSRASMRGTDFGNVSLSNTQLTDAVAFGADLSRTAIPRTPPGLIVDSSTILPDGITHPPLRRDSPGRRLDLSGMDLSLSEIEWFSCVECTLNDVVSIQPLAEGSTSRSGGVPTQYLGCTHCEISDSTIATQCSVRAGADPRNFCMLDLQASRVIRSVLEHSIASDESDTYSVRSCAATLADQPVETVTRLSDVVLEEATLRLSGIWDARVASADSSLEFVACDSFMVAPFGEPGPKKFALDLDISDSELSIVDLRQVPVSSIFVSGDVVGGDVTLSMTSTARPCQMQDLDFVNSSVAGAASCDLTRVSFTRVNLSNVDFSEATFKEVDFSGSDLRRALLPTNLVWRELTWDDDTRWPADVSPPG